MEEVERDGFYAPRIVGTPHLVTSDNECVVVCKVSELLPPEIYMQKLHKPAFEPPDPERIELYRKCCRSCKKENLEKLLDNATQDARAEKVEMGTPALGKERQNAIVDADSAKCLLQGKSLEYTTIVTACRVREYMVYVGGACSAGLGRCVFRIIFHVL